MDSKYLDPIWEYPNSFFSKVIILFSRGAIESSPEQSSEIRRTVTFVRGVTTNKMEHCELFDCQIKFPESVFKEYGGVFGDIRVDSTEVKVEAFLFLI